MNQQWSNNSAEGLTIGERIKVLRERRKMTQRELGAHFGRSEMWIYRIEKGTDFTLQWAMQFSRFFKVSLNYLVYGTDQEPPYIQKV